MNSNVVANDLRLIKVDIKSIQDRINADLLALFPFDTGTMHDIARSVRTRRFTRWCGNLTK